jgi:ADP-ribosylation factor-like protein 1
LRPYWRCYYQDTNAVVYVIDSADRERLDVARQELELMLQEEELRGAPVLVLANKQDLPNAMNEQEVSIQEKTRKKEKIINDLNFS